MVGEDCVLGGRWLVDASPIFTSNINLVAAAYAPLVGGGGARGTTNTATTTVTNDAVMLSTRRSPFLLLGLGSADVAQTFINLGIPLDVVEIHPVKNRSFFFLCSLFFLLIFRCFHTFFNFE